MERQREVMHSTDIRAGMVLSRAVLAGCVLVKVTDVDRYRLEYVTPRGRVGTIEATCYRTLDDELRGHFPATPEQVAKFERIANVASN